MTQQDFQELLTSAIASMCTCKSRFTSSVGDAAENGCLRCVAKYIHKADPKKVQRLPLARAAYHGHADVVRLLSFTEARGINAVGQTALMCAASQGHVPVVQILAPLEARMTCTDGRTALMMAAARGHEVVVRTLLAFEEGCVAQDGNPALVAALSHDQRACFALLLESEKEARAAAIPEELLCFYRGNIQIAKQYRGQWGTLYQGRFNALDFCFLGSSWGTLRLLSTDEKTMSMAANLFLDRRPWSAVFIGGYLSNLKQSSREEIEGLLTVMHHASGRQSGPVFGAALIGGNEPLARRARAFCVPYLGQVATYLQCIPDPQHIPRVIGLLKNLGTTVMGQSLAQVAVKRRGIIAKAIKNNPIKAREAAKITAAQPKGAWKTGRLPYLPAEQEFGFRESEAEAVINRFVVRQTREVTRVTARGQRYSPLIRSSLSSAFKAVWLQYVMTRRTLVQIVKQMLDE